MKRKLICAFILSLLCVITAVGVSAEDISSMLNTPTSNRDTGNITVTGNTGSSSSEYVFVIITGTSTTAADMTESGIITNAYTVGQCVSDESGSFSITLRLAERYGDGQYNCIVYTAGGNNGTQSFTYKSPYLASQALEALSGYQTGAVDGTSDGNESDFLAKFEAVVCGTENLFKTDTTAYYDGFSQAEKERLAETMIKVRGTDTYTSTADFNADFNLVEYLIALDKETTGADVKTFLNTTALEKLLIDERYATASDTAKNAVCGLIANTSLRLPTDLHSLIDSNLIIEEFKAITVWNDLTGLVDKYSDKVTIDSASQTKLNSITKEDACQKMYFYTSEMTSVAGIISAYQKGIADAYTEKYPNGETSGDNGNNGNGGGNGGGGGGGGGAADDTPKDVTGIVLPVVDTTTPKTERERFSDLAGYDWARSAIYELAESGVISGYPDGRYGPGELLTREQVVVMLVNAYQPSTMGDASVFADVKDGAWYYDSIGYAVGTGMIAGMGDGSFGVGLSITRQDFAVMAYNAMGADHTPTGAANMNDMASVSGYARKAVEALIELGVLSGDDNGNIRPKDYTTRAEAAMILSKLR